MSSHVRTYINISTGLLVTSYINQVSTNKNADDRQHGNRYPGCSLKNWTGATKQRRGADDKTTCCRHHMFYLNRKSNKDNY